MTSSSPRRILYVCDFNAHGGTQTHLLHLLGRLDRARFEPALAALSLRPDLASRLAGLDVEVIDLGLRGAWRLSTARAVLGLAARARRRADLLHGYLYQGNILTAAVSALSGVPCVTSVRNMDIRKRLRQRMASGMAHRRARRVLFNSVVVRDATLRLERIPALRAAVIPNGVEDPLAGGGDAPPVERREAPTAICVASLREKKGHEHLIEAFRRVRARMTDARLEIVGEGPLRGRLESAIQSAGLGDAVTLRGYRTDAIALLRGADLFVLASLEEGMPNALLEAMGAGLPAVVTRVGGNGEVVVDGNTGFLVAAADPAALADRILTLLSDEGLRRRMGAAARARFETTFTLPAMIASYHALYEQLLCGGDSVP